MIISFFQVLLALVLVEPYGSTKTYDINPSNTQLSFNAKHFGVINVKGKFSDFKGSIVLSGTLVRKVSVEVKANTINTGNKNRDKSLKTDVFLNPEVYPNIIFESFNNESSSEIEGTLSIKNSSNMAILAYDAKQDGQYLILTGQCAIKRDDFDLDFGTMDSLVSNEVNIEVSIRLKR